MKLSYWQKLLYASGSLGAALSYQAFVAYIQFFYIDHLGVAAALFALGWSVYGLWNAFNDPFVGYLSDRTRSRWGRRVPWIAATAIPLGLFFYLLWMPPASLIVAGEVPLFVYFMAVVLVFDLLWTIIVMNWTSLFPEMVTSVSDRAAVSGWRQFFSLLGLLVGVALLPILAGADWSGRGTMAALFAIITTATFGLSLLGARENPAAQAAPQPPFLPALKATFRSLAFRWFLAANLFKELIFSVLAAAIPFWAKYVLRVQAPVQLGGLSLGVELQNSLLLGLAFVMALPGLPIWTSVARRLGGRRGWQLAQVTFALSMLAIYFAQDFFQGAAATALTGLSLAGLLVFPDLLISDVIDDDEHVTGARREGMYFGVNGFIIRFAFTLQGLIAGLILTGSGYVAASGADLYPAQPDLAVWGIRFLAAGVPMLASLLVVTCLGQYRLHDPRQSQLTHPLPAAGPAASP
jgi:GPH family glycoside/pentoside/hexuronide:cation symporter